MWVCGCACVQVADSLSVQVDKLQQANAERVEEEEGQQPAPMMSKTPGYITMQLSFIQLILCCISPLSFPFPPSPLPLFLSLSLSPAEMPLMITAGPGIGVMPPGMGAPGMMPPGAAPMPGQMPGAGPFFAPQY